mmetsp:Transcript_6963/g.8501  ORF Transcript_6963/g.8501 Transcript_6963/m.8501 type:complete len:270 (-) Transcript_6963:49-858(-)|eukprot:jgi/Bigna1/141352/aug1.62_g16060
MEAYQKSRGGFSFNLCDRNKLLSSDGKATVPKTKKTGTTICGVVYKNGVVLGADTRATEGPIVCDKNCEKIHKITENIWCCGAGTSADTENVTGLIGSQLELHRLATGKEPRVITALTRLKQRLFQYQGYISAALVLGGVDCDGPHIYTVWPHGSTDHLPYATMGSGSLAAMAVFEASYKDDMDEKEAIALVNDAIQAGIWNDLGSGGNVDVMVINKKGTKMLRNMVKPNDRTFHAKGFYKFPKGTTALAEEAKKRFAAMSVSTMEVDS